MSVEKVLLAKPRGFCAGVEMAIKALSWMVRVFDAPVYCYHEIVHNQIVVERFSELGVIFVEDPSKVPLGSPIMLSAHGSSPQVVQAARQVSSITINAVCPLVTKVHHEVKTRAAKGYEIIYIGHHGHDEALGTVAVAPQNVHLVETVAELEEIAMASGDVALIAQTTLAMDEWRAIAERAEELYPSLWTPNKSDLCFATTNRQTAVRHLAPLADVMIVIGSSNSSNTNALEKVARAVSGARVVRINTASDLPDDLSGTVAIAAGASAPEELVAEVIAKLDPIHGTDEISVISEDEYFPPPRELREFLKSLAQITAYAFGEDTAIDSPLAKDSSVSAAEVLAELRSYSATPLID